MNSPLLRPLAAVCSSSPNTHHGASSEGWGHFRHQNQLLVGLRSTFFLATLNCFADTVSEGLGNEAASGQASCGLDGQVSGPRMLLA